MTSDDIENLRILLQRMRKEDADFRVFGSSLHQYRLGLPLLESELAVFEQQHGVTLPADFRFFLKYAGNGSGSHSTERIMSINAGAGPGYGMLPIEEAVLDCNPGKPFPLTDTTPQQPNEDIIQGRDEERYPGVLEIAHHGCAFFSFLVVNGPAYGTIWNADLDTGFEPTGLSFTEWYQRWINRLIDRALPLLARERLVEEVQVKMTKAQVIRICGGPFEQRDFIRAGHSILRFGHLATEFELNEKDEVIRIIRHSI